MCKDVYNPNLEMRGIEYPDDDLQDHFYICKIMPFRNRHHHMFPRLKRLKRGPQALSKETKSSPKLYPWMYDEMLGHVMKWLPLEDLRNCRLVNSTWNTAASMRMQISLGIQDFINLIIEAII